MTGDFMIAGVSALALVVGLVMVAKLRLHWRGDRLVYSALGLSMFLSIGTYLSGRFPEYRELWLSVVGGLFLWVSAMGTWSGGKTISGK